jgi:MOSC domain-containing protein YiiM
LAQFPGEKKAMHPDSLVHNIKVQFPAQGLVRWIGLRPARGEPMQTVESAELTVQVGIRGDHYAGKAGSDRQVTLIQAEHLSVVAQFLGQAEIDPVMTRRNLVVSGINLIALKHCVFSIGDVLLSGTGACAPCSKMEYNLGTGGYNAMRGHGGITASVMRGGTIQLGASVIARPDLGGSLEE